MIPGLKGAAIGLLIGAVAAGTLVHRYDTAQHDKVIASLEATAAKTLTTRVEEVLARERTARQHLDNLEIAYGRLSEDRARAGAESIRLSGQLDNALGRLRRIGAAGGGGDRMPAGDAGVDRCTDVRAALGRAAAAVERLKSGGDAAAAIGQHAVDVATIAAQDARR